MSKVWMYHPEKGAKLFDSFDDVPDGWFDSPDFENALVVETQAGDPDPQKEPDPPKVSGKKGKRTRKGKK